jgi:hypothetical protein
MFGFGQHFITKQFVPFFQRSILSMNLATNEREKKTFGPLLAIAGRCCSATSICKEGF